jgi:hypothetical protein
MGWKMSRELLQQCLNKFEHLWEIGIDAHYRVDLISDIRALREELAKPEQEPVGWFLKDHLETYMESYKDIEGAIPLYTAPPRKEWVGLTAEEIFEITERLTKEGGVNCDGWIVAVEVQQKLKEKNHEYF